MTGQLELQLWPPSTRRAAGLVDPPRSGPPADLSDLDWERGERLLAAEPVATSKLYHPQRAPSCRCPRPLLDDDHCCRCGRRLGDGGHR